MKILVIMDNDGHFQAAHPTDRKATINLLKNIHDGDYYHDVIDNDNLEIPENLDELCCQEWNNFIDYFIQRGTLEYVEVPDIIPIGCKCG